MALTITASSTGASAIRGAAARSRRAVLVLKPQQQQQQHGLVRQPQQQQQPKQRQQQQQQQQQQQRQPSRTRAASPDVEPAPTPLRRPDVAARAAAAAAAAAPAAPAAAAKSAAGPDPTKPFANVQRFVVAPQSLPAFQACWREREAAMRRQPGFGGLSLVSDGLGSGDTVVTARWASAADFERWMLDDACRRSHLPPGVWQYVPRRGEGFPEDFVPFVNYDEPVNAKYF
jgi:heme-degrading monooxygenase HmoA